MKLIKNADACSLVAFSKLATDNKHDIPKLENTPETPNDQILPQGRWCTDLQRLHIWYIVIRNWFTNTDQDFAIKNILLKDHKQPIVQAKFSPSLAEHDMPCLSKQCTSTSRKHTNIILTLLNPTFM